MVHTVTTVVQTVPVKVISLLLHTPDARRFNQDAPRRNSRPLIRYLTEEHSGFPQSLHTNIKTKPRSRSRPLPSTPFPVHYSLVILPLWLFTELLTASLNKQPTARKQMLFNFSYSCLVDVLVTKNGFTNCRQIYSRSPINKM
jgi:hypothetical protein